MDTLKVLLVLAIVAVLMGLAVRWLSHRKVWLDRLLVQGKFRPIFILLAVVVLIPVVISLVSVLFRISGEDLIGSDAAPSSVFSAIYYHFVDPGLQNMALGSHRLLVAVIALLGTVFMNGILVSALVGWYDRYIDSWVSGQARYDRLLKKSRFIVIIGDNEAVPSIIKQIFCRRNPVDYVVIQTNDSVEYLRKQLASFLSEKNESQTIIYSGERTSKEDVRDLHLECAEEVFLLGDRYEELSAVASHDSMNMNCLQIIACMLKEKKRKDKLVCNVMFEYQTTFSIFQFADISNTVKGYIDFRPMNYYEMWAQRVLVQENLTFDRSGYKGYLPIEGWKPIDKDSNDFVHLVIVGMSQMGVALGIETAQLAHFPNFVNKPHKRTRITFIDSKCKRNMGFFKGRFKELFAVSQWRYAVSDGNTELYKEAAVAENWNNADVNTREQHLGKDFIDVEWEFIDGGLETTEIHKFLSDAADNPHARFTLAICLPKDNASVAGALYLPEVVYEKAQQILVYQRHNDAIVNSIARENTINKLYERLKPFGMLDSVYNDRLINNMYKAAGILDGLYYEMYLAVNKENNVEPGNRVNTRGKSKSAGLWSNIYNANTMWGKMRSINYTAGEEIKPELLEILACTEHNRWSVEQLLMKFRTLTAEEQNRACTIPGEKELLKGDKMAHLDICSFERLGEVDFVTKEYDRGFIRIIPEILKAIKY